MEYSRVAKYIKITNNKAEMVLIGRQIADEFKEIYTPLMFDKMMESINSHAPQADTNEKTDLLYQSIYDYWVYGCNVDEEFYLHFVDKTDSEKREYLVQRLRHIYVHHLNSGGGKEIVAQLEDKYQLYQRIKSYFKRDMIEVKGQSDYDLFKNFVQEHGVFVVKPSDFYCGIGVHKDTLSNYDNDIKTAFDSIINEGLAIKKRHPSRESKMVIEELIIQDESLAALHRESVNAIRATAVRGKDGNIHLFHPWIKVGINGTFVASAALDGFDAEIDPNTGIVITDGYQESGFVYKTHPNTGVMIKGMQIPQWKELIKFVEELMMELPEYGYIGWDLVLTPKGWCVMEGNYSGEFTFQLINGRGYKKEFEELIGWKYDKDYWWQDSMAYFGK